MNHVYYYKKLRIILITFIAAPAMIAASLYVTSIPSGIMTKLIGYIGVAFFGLCFIIGLRNFLCGSFRREVLVLTPASLTINSPSQVCYKLPWSDINGFERVDIAREHMLVIHLHDVQRFIEQNSGTAFGRILMKANICCVGSPCSIALNNIDADEDEIMHILEQYLTRYSRKAAPEDGPAQD